MRPSYMNDPDPMSQMSDVPAFEEEIRIKSDLTFRMAATIKTNMSLPRDNQLSGLPAKERFH